MRAPRFWISLLASAAFACGSSEITGNPDAAPSQDATPADNGVTIKPDSGVSPDAEPTDTSTALSPVWTETFSVPPVIPAERWGARMVNIPPDKRFLIFGGAQTLDNGATLSDHWNYWLDNPVWERLGTRNGPPARYCHCLAYLPDQRQVLLVGGRDLGGPLPAAAWTYDLASDTWERIQGEAPPGVIGCNVEWMPTFPGGGRAIVFGGGSAAGLSAQTHAYDPVARTFTRLAPPNSPPGRSDAMMAYDPGNGGRLLLWSGAINVFPPENARFRDDFWVFDGNDWRPIQPGGAVQPAPRRFSGSAFDEARREWIIYSGTNEVSQFDEVWRFDATTDTWESLPIRGAKPRPRGFSGFAYDPSSDAYYLLGGLTQPDYFDVADGWVLKLRP